MTDELQVAPIYLGDLAAIAWLDAHGIHVGPRFLKDMRWRGIGPRTVFQGKTALTTEEWLTVWLPTILLPRHPRVMAGERRIQAAASSASAGAKRGRGRPRKAKPAEMVRP